MVKKGGMGREVCEARSSPGGPGGGGRAVLSL